jgi:hypothetical protein
MSGTSSCGPEPDDFVSSGSPFLPPWKSPCKKDPIEELGIIAFCMLKGIIWHKSHV